MRGLCQHLDLAWGDLLRNSEHTPKSLSMFLSCCTLDGLLMIASIPISNPIWIYSSMFANSHLLQWSPASCCVSTDVMKWKLNSRSSTLYHKKQCMGEEYWTCILGGRLIWASHLNILRLQAGLTPIMVSNCHNEDLGSKSWASKIFVLCLPYFTHSSIIICRCNSQVHEEDWKASIRLV